MAPIVIYTRVSTGQQADEGLSLAAQLSKCRAYCKLYDLRIVKRCEDAGISAKTLERPGLIAALECLESGEAEGLLVVKLDRLTRSVKDLGMLIEEYFGEKKAYRLMSVQESVDTRTAAGRMVVNMLMTVAQWEREVISERTRAVLSFKKQRGELVGGQPPYGYHVAERDGVRILEIDAHEREVMEIAGDLAAEDCSYAEIARHLNEREYDTRTGKPWGRQAVSRVVKRVEEEVDA